jgi:hypothetical protein
LGLLMGVAGLATPAPFAVLSRAEAGRVVGRVLAGEARARLALGAVLLRLEQREAKARATVGTGSRFSGSMVLALGAIFFFTVAGCFAVQPRFALARLGQSVLGLSQLHAVSVAFFGCKLALVAALAWLAATPRANRGPSSSG